MIITPAKVTLPRDRPNATASSPSLFFGADQMFLLVETFDQIVRFALEQLLHLKRLIRVLAMNRLIQAEFLAHLGHFNGSEQVNDPQHAVGESKCPDG